MLLAARIESPADFAVQVPFMVLGAAIAAWGWSPLAQWLARRLLELELKPKPAWWIGFVAFGTWSLITNAADLVNSPPWLAVSAGLMGTALIAPVFAQRALSREAGRETRIGEAAAVALGTFGTPLVILSAVLVIVWFFRPK